jgi:tetratricopeptide (TPR) repeat protein
MDRPSERNGEWSLKYNLSALLLVMSILAAGRLPAQDTTDAPPLERGKQAYRDAQWDLAVPLLVQEAIAVPSNVEAWLFLASCFDRLNQPAQASKALKQAAVANPGLVIVHTGLGVYYGRLHLAEDQVVARLAALKLEPDFAAAYHAIGLAYARLGQFPEAVGAYRQAIRIRPDCAEVHSNLAAAYYSQQKWEKALHSAREAVRLDDQNAEAHFNLGACLLKTGDQCGALRECDTLKKLGSGLFDELNASIAAGYTLSAADIARPMPRRD